MKVTIDSTIRDIVTEMKRIGIPGTSKVNGKSKEVFVKLIRQEKLKRKRGKPEEIKKRETKRKAKIIKGIRVRRIIVEPDYWTSCSMCRRDLKKAIVTNYGTMGYRCYLSSIGVPSPRGKITFRKLPVEAFEPLAETLIMAIEKASPNELVALVNFYNHELIPPVRFGSNIHINYRHMYKGQVHEFWANLLTMQNRLSRLGKLVGFPSEVIEKILMTKTFNQYFQYQSKIIRFNDKNPRERREDLHGDMNTPYHRYYRFPPI